MNLDVLRLILLRKGPLSSFTMNQQRKRARQRYSALVSQPTVIPDVYGSKKRATEAVRRQLEKDNDSEFDSFDLEDWPIMSDTAAAAQLLIEQAIGPKHKGSESARRIPRICLVHQIYAILSDNTTVDREVVNAIMQREKI